MRTRATALLVRNNMILMIHRRNHGKEYWVLPGGGVEESEKVETTVLRELAEETSIEALLKEKLLEFTDNDGNKHVVYLCEYISGTPKLQGGSVEANNIDKEQSYKPQWVRIDDISSLTIYPTEEKELLLKYLNA